MTIIAIISAAILGTASAAMENARRTRTQSLITKIHGLLMERWDSYATRRIDVNQLITGDGYLSPEANTIEGKFKAGTITAAERGAMLADLRLLALRELMKMEMPDRWSDICNQDLPAPDVQNAPTFLNVNSVPGLSRIYYRRLLEAQKNTAPSLVELAANQSAECLYMIVMFGTGDGEARTMFTSKDFGDTDGDGAPEFLDAWGKPLHFIRWPAGFVPASTIMTGLGDTDHDPFDVFLRDTPAVAVANDPPPNQYPPGPFQLGVRLMRERNEEALNSSPNAVPRLYLSAFRIVPLVYSDGADGESSLRLWGKDADDEDAADSAIYGVDPYALTSDGFQNGSPNPDEDAWRDNIHNHLNEY